MPPSKKLKKDKKEKYCRICLSVKSENRVTFDIDSEWSRLMEYCIGITVISQIGSTILCKECSKKLKEFSEFKTLALQSHGWWSSVLPPALKEDPAEKIETVEIKDEHCSHNFQDVEYLDFDFLPDNDNDVHADDIKEQEEVVNDDKPEIFTNNEINKEENKVKEEVAPSRKFCKKKPKVEELSKGLSEDAFIKKFFEVLNKDEKGKWKVAYRCLQCGEEFKRRSTLPPHVQKCYKSQVSIIKKKALKENTQKVHAPPSVLDCGLCPFSSSDENATMRHVREQHCGGAALACQLCDYTGRDTADMVSHRYRHVAATYMYRGKFRCPVCDKLRLNELSLQFHVRAQHGAAGAGGAGGARPGGWCRRCGKTFTGYIYFRNHLRWHDNAKYICDFCGAKFLFRNLIEAHIKEHMNVRDYVCHTCGKRFKRNNALSGHIRACHTEHKRAPCAHCGKLFKNEYSLRMHMKMVSKGNDYICDVCCKGYPTLSLLKKHMFWHSGERPFACAACGGRYKSKGNLKLHMRKHAGVYPFKCGECDKPFMTSTQLRAHSAVHTGVRRVPCPAPACARSFHERRQMLAHLQAKHAAAAAPAPAPALSSVPV